MIGIDTNLLVRAFLADHSVESKQAQDFIKRTTRRGILFISAYAILEMVWVLKTKKFNRQEIADVVLTLIDSPGIVIGQRATLISALEFYVKGKADFADYFIMAEGMENGAHQLATFDKILIKDRTEAKEPKAIKL